MKLYGVDRCGCFSFASHTYACDVSCGCRTFFLVPADELTEWEIWDMIDDGVDERRRADGLAAVRERNVQPHHLVGTELRWMPTATMAAAS